MRIAAFQQQGIMISSGALGSTTGQIGRRIKIFGAQWNRNNLSQVLKHHCAYLTNAMSTFTHCISEMLPITL